MHPLPRRRPARHAIPRPRCGTPSRQIPVQRSAVRLTMVAEVGYSPLWVESGSAMVNTTPSELLVPAGLAREIEAWAGSYELAGEPDEAFFAHGMRLAIRLAESLGPQSSVHFFDGREGCLRRV